MRTRSATSRGLPVVCRAPRSTPSPPRRASTCCAARAPPVPRGTARSHCSAWPPMPGLPRRWSRSTRSPRPRSRPTSRAYRSPSPPAIRRSAPLRSAAWSSARAAPRHSARPGDRRRRGHPRHRTRHVGLAAPPPRVPRVGGRRRYSARRRVRHRRHGSAPRVLPLGRESDERAVGRPAHLAARLGERGSGPRRGLDRQDEALGERIQVGTARR